MGKPEQTGESHSYFSHCKPCLTCRKGVGERNKLKTNISVEKKTILFDEWKKTQSNSNTGNSVFY